MAAHYAVLVTQPFLARSGTSLRVVPGAQFQLVRKGTNTPAVIYTNDTMGVIKDANGQVTADADGVWKEYLNPDFEYEPIYKGVRFASFSVAPDRREADYDLAAFATAKGLDDVVDGETIATREWITSQIGSGDGLDAAAVQAIVDTAIDELDIPDIPDIPDAPDLTPYATTRGFDEDELDLVIKSGVPNGTTLTQWAEARAYVRGTKGWLEPLAAGQAPEPTTPPVTSDITGWLGLTAPYTVNKYYDATLQVVDTSTGTATTKDLSRVLEQLVVARDQITFNSLFNKAQTSLRRTAESNAKDCYYAAWNETTLVPSNTVVDAPGMLDIFGVLVRAWNLWGGAAYRDAASKIFSDLVNYCTIYDEGRAYLCKDNQQKLVTDGGTQFGHHVHPTNGGYVSAHKLGVINPIHFRAAKVFTGAAVCDKLLDGYYDLLVKLANASPTQGLVPDYASYNTATHAVGYITTGVDGWAETLSQNFGFTQGQNVAPALAIDKQLFGETRGDGVITQLKAFYSGRWTSVGAFYTNYNLSGVSQNTTQTTEIAFNAIRILTVDDNGNATAAAIRSAKIPIALGGTEALGRYIPNQIKGATPAAGFDATLRAWLAFAKDNNTWQDIAKLGTNPSVGTLYPPGNTGSGTTTPVVVTPPNGTDPSTPAPVGNYNLYVNSEGQPKSWYNSIDGVAQPTLKTRAGWYVSQPMPFWSGIEWDPNCDGMKAYIDRAAARNEVAQVLAYSIPGRDLGQYSAGGATNRAAYEVWIGKFIQAIGTRQVLVIYEPDSITHASELPEDPRNGRFSIMTWAILQIQTQCPNVWLYADVGHPQWKSVSDAASLLQNIHVENTNGFAINVSNFVSFDQCVAYGQSIRGVLGSNVHFIIDTGRSGNTNPAEHWANPKQRRFGRLPQLGNTGIDGLDAVGWYKIPGESDGASGDGAPAAGSFFPTYLYNSAVSDNTNGGTHATSAGMLQRPPTPGVAVVAQ